MCTKIFKTRVSVVTVLLLSKHLHYYRNNDETMRGVNFLGTPGISRYAHVTSRRRQGCKGEVM